MCVCVGWGGGTKVRNQCKKLYEQAECINIEMSQEYAKVFAVLGIQNPILSRTQPQLKK